MENLEHLNQKLEAIERRATYSPNLPAETQSRELGELFGALAKAQSEMEIAKTDSSNPFFKSKYADLASVVKASRPYLAKNGLTVVQRLLPNGEGLYLHTTLGHSSGQWMESKMRVNPPKTDIQTVGSYITYLRRYTYAAITGVAAADEDDDGEVSMERKSKASIGKNINSAQLQLLSAELDGHEELLENILGGFEISKLSDLPAEQYSKTMNRIRDIKAAEKK